MTNMRFFLRVKPLAYQASRQMSIYSHATMTKENGGYAENCSDKSLFVNVSKQKTIEIVDRYVKSKPSIKEPFTIVEYGSANGATSVELIRDIIDVVRARCGHEKEINVIYEDIPTNDFNSLFERHSGLLSNKRAYRFEDENTFVTASGTDFFHQCVPSSSVDLALSFLAAHYLSRPIELDDSIHRSFTKNNIQKSIINKQAAEDWEKFLTIRSKELKPGGWGVITHIGELETKIAPYHIYKYLDDIWNDFLARNIITLEEHRIAAYSACHRTPREIQEPFVNSSNDFLKTGLKLDCLETKTISDNFIDGWKKKLEEDGIDDRQRFVEGLTKSVRAFTYDNIIYRALSAERTQEDKRGICTKFYEEYESKLMNTKLNQLDIDYIMHVAYLHKVK